MAIKKAAGSTTDFVQFLQARLAKDPGLANAVEAVGVEADIAEEIYQARRDAGLTQKQLADRVGTQQSVIARLEDADYRSHTVNMLRRIAAATGKQLEIAFRSKPVSSSAGTDDTRIIPKKNNHESHE